MQDRSPSVLGSLRGIPWVIAGCSLPQTGIQLALIFMNRNNPMGSGEWPVLWVDHLLFVPLLHTLPRRDKWLLWAPCLRGWFSQQAPCRSLAGLIQLWTIAFASHAESPFSCGRWSIEFSLRRSMAALTETNGRCHLLRRPSKATCPLPSRPQCTKGFPTTCSRG